MAKRLITVNATADGLVIDGVLGVPGALSGGITLKAGQYACDDPTAEKIMRVGLEKFGTSGTGPNVFDATPTATFNPGRGWVLPPLDVPNLTKVA